jgi:hypothetical protein
LKPRHLILNSRSALLNVFCNASPNYLIGGYTKPAISTSG